MPEVDLNAEAIKFAQHYIQKKVQGADLVTKTAALNGAACGFYAAVRWIEKQARLKTDSACPIHDRGLLLPDIECRCDKGKKP